MATASAFCSTNFDEQSDVDGPVYYCELCNRAFCEETLLLLHKEYECNPEYTCPICNQIFYDSSVLQIHVNEDHDNSQMGSYAQAVKSGLSTNVTSTTVSDSLYAQDIQRRQQMKEQYEMSKTTVSMSEEGEKDDDQFNNDHALALTIQQEEDDENFKAFQRRYGANNQSFSDRAQQNLDNHLKKNFISQAEYNDFKMKLNQLAKQPVERQESRTQGIIDSIHHFVPTNGVGGVIDRRLVSNCDHFSATWLDGGWSCGYKNFQMLLSSMMHDVQYRQKLFCERSDIPSVTRLQQLIEEAWRNGFDSQGREQFNGRLYQSTKWIGPTEITACLAHCKIKTELLDFHKPTNVPKSSSYQYLFKWIKDYFDNESSKRDRIVHPLYLQHEGHSRTIIGYEQMRGAPIRLLLYDPGTPKFEYENFLKSPRQKMYILRRTLQSFNKPVYQILVLRGLLNPQEQETAKIIRSTKVS
ncbi:unnamed protein product [Didymodactylos carnosus]|uniref:C2H2-type domain-containing protein n=1 Tax=Didymodactylos carnosus TaxID=1234261 RepID=A0A813YCY3_9BILA|nr:unnamed protein product [Didymodactylos carnosus]CAF1199314.1 unnamed protein product [Didymodactylos carnosus]CAF3668391.1 unnamed protein product [Didymodactylos carnosus]CAF4009439.1 unnamed protein product [Didymodactylos carnosus]